MEEREGRLRVQLIPKWQGYGLNGLIKDVFEPEYLKNPTAYVTSAEQDDLRGHVWSIRGKALETLTIADDGRRVRIRGRFTYGPASLPHRELARVTHVTLTFLDEVAT